MFKVLILTLFISGCVYVPVVQKFPDVPKELLTEPNELLTLKYDSNFEDLLTTVVNNYGICQENNIKLEAWQEWYKQQSKIFNNKK